VQNVIMEMTAMKSFMVNVLIVILRLEKDRRNACSAIRKENKCFPG